MIWLLAYLAAGILLTVFMWAATNSSVRWSGWGESFVAFLVTACLWPIAFAYWVGDRIRS